MCVSDLNVLDNSYMFDKVFILLAFLNLPLLWLLVMISTMRRMCICLVATLRFILYEGSSLPVSVGRGTRVRVMFWVVLPRL